MMRFSLANVSFQAWPPTPPRLWKVKESQITPTTRAIAAPTPMIVNHGDGDDDGGVDEG